MHCYVFTVSTVQQPPQFFTNFCDCDFNFCCHRVCSILGKIILKIKNFVVEFTVGPTRKLRLSNVRDSCARSNCKWPNEINNINSTIQMTFTHYLLCNWRKKRHSSLLISFLTFDKYLSTASTRDELRHDRMVGKQKRVKGPTRWLDSVCKAPSIQAFLHKDRAIWRAWIYKLVSIDGHNLQSRGHD